MELSNRQVLIMQSLVDGMTAKEIAVELGVSKGVITKHMQRVRAKLNVRSMYQCIAILVIRNIVTPKDANRIVDK